MAEFSIVPLGKGVRLSTVIADVMKVVVGSGVCLPTQWGPYSKESGMR